MGYCKAGVLGLTLSFLLTVTCAAMPAQQTELEKAEELVQFVLDQFHIPPPLEVVIDLQSFGKMEKAIAKDRWPTTMECDVFGECRLVNHRPSGPAGIIHIRGMTEIEALGERKLYITVAEYDRQTLVHETLHYVLYWMTNTHPFFGDDHPILYPLLYQFTVSQTYVDWLIEHR